MKQPLYISGTTGGNPKAAFLWGRAIFHSQSCSTPMPVDGAIANWRVVLKTAPSGGNTKSLSVYKNGSATSLTITFAAGETDKSDTSHTVTVTAGDLVHIEQANTGSDTASDFESSIEWTPDDGVSSVHGHGCWNPRYDTSVVYDGAVAGGDIGSTDAHESSYVGSAGTITAHYQNLNSAPGAGQSRTFVLILNGVAQDGTGGTPDTSVTISDAATTGSATFSLAIASGDLLSVRMTPSAAPAATGGSGSVAFEPTTAGQAPIGMDTAISNGAGTHYAHVTGSFARFGDWSTTETDKQNIGAQSTVWLYGMGVWLDAAPGSGKSRVFTLRKNGADTGQTVALTGTTTSAICTGPPARVDAGDRIALEEIVTGTPAGSLAKVSWYLSGEPIRGSAVFGVNTTVKATRAIAFGLDGATNVHDRPGQFKVFGDQAITGDLDVDGDLHVLGNLGALNDLSDVAIGSPLAAGDVLEYDGAAWTNVAPAGGIVRTVGCIIGDGVNVITTGPAGFLSVPATGTITKVRILSSDPAVTSGSIVLDIWKDTFANYPPTVLDSITGSPKPGLSSETSAEDTSLNGTSVTAGDVLGFNVDSVTDLTQITVEVSIAEA